MTTNRWCHALARLIAFGFALLVLGLPAGHAQCDQWLPGNPPAGSPFRAIGVWDPDGPGPRNELPVVSAGIVNNPQSVMFYEDGGWRTLGAAANGQIQCLVNHAGSLVIGGTFTSIGAAPANRVARWDGAQWVPIGAGLNQSVTALGVISGELYAAADGVHRWTGSAWQRLGVWIGTGVKSLIEFQGSVIAAGGFVTSAGMPGQYIARWDGGAWQPVGELSGPVNSAANYHGVLHAGGMFTIGGFAQPQAVVRWDGAAWRAFSGGLEGATQALAVHDSGLVAAGTFYPLFTFHVAVWNGSWTRLPLIGSLDGSPIGAISCSGDLLVWGTTLHVWQSNNTSHVDHLLRFDGLGWNPLAGEYPATALSTFGGDLVAGGDFLCMGKAWAEGVARWDGVEWSSFGAGLQLRRLLANSAWPEVKVLHEFGGQLVAGGSFTNPRHLARWDGTAWSLFGPTPEPAVSLSSTSTELVASAYPSSVMKWNGSAWDVLPVPIGASVNCVRWQNDNLYAAGVFQFGGTWASRVVRWDGTAWQPVGSGFTTISTITSAGVYTLGEFNGELIAGGRFTAADGNPAANVARWNGAAWVALGEGIVGPTDSIVYALESYHGSLVAGGGIASASSPMTPFVRRWDGIQWNPLGNLPLVPQSPGSTLDAVHSLTVSHGELVVAGDFAFASGNTARGFARWTDSGIPWIAVQPKPLTVSIATMARFGVTPANGYSQIAYEWRRNGIPLSDGHTPQGSLIAGSTAAALSISNVTPVDAGDYDCVVTNPCGSVTSATASLNVDGSCYANCDGSTTPPVLSAQDFLCFIQRFSECSALPPAQQLGCYANCDSSATPPILNITDFMCFVNAFAAGCP